MVPLTPYRLAPDINFPPNYPTVIALGQAEVPIRTGEVFPQRRGNMGHPDWSSGAGCVW